MLTSKQTRYSTIWTNRRTRRWIRRAMALKARRRMASWQSWWMPTWATPRSIGTWIALKNQATRKAISIQLSVVKRTCTVTTSKVLTHRRLSNASCLKSRRDVRLLWITIAKGIISMSQCLSTVRPAHIWIKRSPLLPLTPRTVALSANQCQAT